MLKCIRNNWLNLKAKFIAITKFWEIFNIKNTSQRIIQNNKNLMPINCGIDERLKFLLKFSNWLEKWINDCLSENKLTKDTFGALIFSSRSIIQLCHYLLGKLEIKYILTRKFQTDCLESRFGQYRQGAGGNYHITSKQIIEVEKKIRTKNFIQMHSCLKNFSEDIQNVIFTTQFLTNFLFNFRIIQKWV